MRVAVFTDMDLDAMNGVTTRLRALVRCAPRDVRPRIYTASAVEVDEPDFLAARAAGLPIYDRGSARMYIPPLCRFQRHLTRDAARVIHMTTPGPSGLAARHLARCTRLPLVGSIHGLSAPAGDAVLARYGASIADSYVRWAYAPCERILVPSGEAAEALAAKGWDRDRLEVWPTGVDAGAFSPTHRSPMLRDSWHVCDKRPAILFVGSLARDRGLSLIEPVSAILHQQRVAHRFIIAGVGSMRSEIEERCPDAVVSGALSPQAVAVAMASADLFVYPRANAMAGTSVLEAQASGLPAVVAEGTGSHASIGHGVTGFACRQGDAAQFAARLAELIANVEQRRRFSEAARRFALSRSWSASLGPVYETYRNAALQSEPRSVQNRASTLSPLNREAGRRA
jgi:glycosyltransferase involved in cell wall biosynthesis